MQSRQAKTQPDSSREADASARLIDAAGGLASRVGYAGLTVAAIAQAARVSRTAFYQHFASAEDCFWAAYRLHAEELLRSVEAAVARSEQPELAAVQALVEACQARPGAMRLLMREGLAAGAGDASGRDGLIAQIERAVGRQRAGGSIDLPPAILLGGVFRFLAMRLNDCAPMDGVERDVERWLCTYRIDAGAAGWSERLMPRMPAPADPRKLRSRSAPCSGGPRARIIDATAVLIRERGYRQLTVAEIAKRAGVSRRSFYKLFASRTDAFIACYEDAFRRTVAACTPAFFAAREWPEQIWQGIEAATRLLSQDPLSAYIGFVECHVLGPSFAPRVHDTQLAFTLFLEDGYRQRPEAQLLPRACSELIAATIFEAGFQASLRGPGANLRSFQPLAAYVALTPFIGHRAAGAFVVAKLRSRKALLKAAVA